YGQNTRFIELAGEINTSMPEYVVRRLADALNERQKAVKGSSILIVGLAYKPNVDDERESPSYVLMEMLQRRGAKGPYDDPYDRKYLEAAAVSQPLSLHFHDFRLDASVASIAAASKAVCVFVNDCVDASCLKILSSAGIKLIALRCAGYNNVDLTTAKSLGIGGV